MANGTNNNNQPKKVTDPKLLSQLNGGKVTDPNVLAQLNGQPQGNLGLGDVVMGAIGNFPSSYQKFGENILAPLVHPIETAKNLGNLGLATAKTALVPSLAVQDPQVQQAFHPIIDFYKQRYGGWENLKKTVAEDPAGFLADLSVVLQGGGVAMKGIGQAARGEAASNALGAATRAGESMGIIDVAKGMTPRAYQIGERGTLNDALKAVQTYKELGKSAPTIENAQAMQVARETAEGYIQKATGLDLGKRALTIPQIEQTLSEIQARPNLFERLGGALGTAGKLTDPNPFTVAQNVATKAVPSSLPSRLYGSSIKFSTKLAPEERAAQIATGLREGVLPTESGLEKLRGTIDEVNASIGQTIEAGKKAGDVIPAKDITSRLDGVREFFKYTTNPDEYLSQIDNIEKSFIKAHREQVPVAVAQKVKQNTYVLLRKAYGEMKSAAVETNKQIARGIKEELAAKYPALKNLNARDSELIQLEASIERSVARIGNRDIIGIGTPIAGAAGAALFPSAKTAGVGVGIMKSIIDNPRVKAALGIALTKARQRTAGGLAPILNLGGRTLSPNNQ